MTLFLLIFTCLRAAAQTEYIGSAIQSGGTSICASESGGAYMVLARNQDVQPPLVKLNVVGDTLWVKFPFQMMPATGNNVHLGDDHLIVVGQGRIYKITFDGDIIWKRAFTEDDLTDSGNWISTVLADGSVVVCRTTINPNNSIVPDHYRPILLRVSSEGDLLWTAEHLLEGQQRFYSIASDGNGTLHLGGRGVLMSVSESTGELEAAYTVPGEFGGTNTVYLTPVHPQPDGARYWGAVTSGPLGGFPAIATFFLDNEGNPSPWEYYGIEQGGTFTAQVNAVLRQDGSRVISSGKVLMVIDADGELISASTLDLPPLGANIVTLGLASDGLSMLMTGTVGTQQSPNTFYAHTIPEISSLCEFNAFNLTRVTGNVPDLTPQTTAYATLGGLLDFPVFPFPPPALLTLGDPCMSVGVESAPAHSGYSVHPNPAHTTITLNTETLSQGTVATVIDRMGRVVGSLDLAHPRTTMDVSHLSAGIYMLHFHDHEGARSVQFMKE